MCFWTPKNIPSIYRLCVSVFSCLSLSLFMFCHSLTESSFPFYGVDCLWKIWTVDAIQCLFVLQEKNGFEESCRIRIMGWWLLVLWVKRTNNQNCTDDFRHKPHTVDRRRPYKSITADSVFQSESHIRTPNTQTLNLHTLALNKTITTTTQYTTAASTPNTNRVSRSVLVSSDFSIYKLQMG